MKKPYKHTDKDPNHRCERCTVPLKRNVLARKTTKVKYCYPCWLIKTGKVRLPDTVGDGIGEQNHA